MTDDTKAKIRQSFLAFDGNIPFTFVIGLGLMWATYSFSEQQGLKDRLTMSETTAVEYRKKVDRLEQDQRDIATMLNGMRSDISLVKELMLRLEKRTEAMATAR
jgi:hypothetical protein